MSTLPGRFQSGLFPMKTKTENATWLRKNYGRVFLGVMGLVFLANADAVWALIKEVVPIALEVMEQTLDSVLETWVGLSPHNAQTATAYIGLASALVLAYWLARQCMKLLEMARQTLFAFVDAARAWWQAKCLWWDSLHDLAKYLMIAAFVCAAIPVAILLSIFLGSAAAIFL